MTIKKYHSDLLICGCDEAGRGALAGPVVASAVMLKNDFFHPDLNDSKKLSKNKRIQLAKYIKTKSLQWSIGIINVKEIDKINILNSSIKAMHIAIDEIIKKSEKKPELLIIDGNKFNPYPNINHKCIIKGDAKFASIAAASIIAKTHRDTIMHKLHIKYPEYNWLCNNGYPTKEHRKQIISYGISIHHRKSFKLLEKQYTLQL
ncbi:MAG: ribonuclease HII [Flavobacteriales bacterium]|nr:ribonuclease HII [Flavobacteriales bacterium]